MPEATAEFFERLGRTGHEPLLEKATGRIRFEDQMSSPETYPARPYRFSNRLVCRSSKVRGSCWSDKKDSSEAVAV